MESRKEKFLENDLIGGSDQFHYILSKKDQYQGQTSGSNHRPTVIHTHEVETGIRQLVIENPQTFEPVDHVVEEQQNIEQPIENSIEQQVPHEETTLRRFTKVRNSVIPSDYVVYFQELDHNIGAEHDSKTFSQAMKDEIDSMASNRVWDLVEFPYGVKTIGCKWVFKTKKDSQDNIERQKVRLVAKRFTQMEGIDYTKTFSLVSRKDSLRVIMTLVSHLDLELHQMDVKTTFCNGELEEEVYMKRRILLECW